MNTNDIKVKLGIPMSAVQRMLKEKKIKAVHSMPFGRGEMHFYNVPDVQPIIDAYMAKHAVKVPSPAVVSKPDDAPLKVVMLALDRQAQINAEALTTLERKLTEQNRFVIAAMEKQNKLLLIFAEQLGVTA